MSGTPESVLAARGQAARVAMDVVGGSRELFDGLLEIVALVPELGIEEDDEDLSRLLDVAAELEDLPVGEERGAWPRRLLAEADQEIAQRKRLYRSDLLVVLRRLVQRFSAERRASS